MLGHFWKIIVIKKEDFAKWTKMGLILSVLSRKD